MEFNKTYDIIITNYSFHTLPSEVLIEIYKDGRVFSHFIERQLAQDFGLKHVGGCQYYDIADTTDPDIKYEQKTFTANGCKFMPSNMIGVGRTFDQTIFAEKAAKLIYIIVSNVAFPNIKIKFVSGTDMLALYPTGIIPKGNHDEFFNM